MDEGKQVYPPMREHGCNRHALDEIGEHLEPRFKGLGSPPARGPDDARAADLIVARQCADDGHA